MKNIVLGFLFLGLAGCATYQKKVEGSRDLLRSGDPQKAIEVLEPLAQTPGDDQLVYLFDYATALQMAGRYKDSAKAFAQAEAIADIKDYHSITRVAGSVLLSEEFVQYKGDDYEKVLINGMNAVNFLMTDDLEGALVEVRRLNNKLYKYKYEAKRNYQQSPYAFYLSAIIWEADRKWDDAYIAYKNAYEVNPNYLPLREDLVRAAIRAQRPEDVAKWKAAFPEVKVLPEWKDRNLGEVVLIYQQGWGPRKYPRPENQRFPKLYPVFTATRRANLEVFVPNVTAPVASVVTSEIFSVQNVAIKTLDDDFNELVAKRIVGVVAKAVVAEQIRQKNELLGGLAWVAMNVADRADLRQWSTLPETFQIARATVKPGKYKVRISGLFGPGGTSGEVSPEQEIEVKPGRKVFIGWRSLK